MSEAKRNKHKIKHNQGSTMVEVLVGFVVLMIMMVSVVAITKLSTELVFDSKDIKEEQQRMEQQLYKNNNGSLTVHTDATFYPNMIEVDENGEIKDGGNAFRLDNARVSEYIDPTSNMTVYRINYDR